MDNDFKQVFAMLRAVRGSSDRAAGFARFEVKGGKCTSSMTAQGLNKGETYCLMLLDAAGDSIEQIGRTSAAMSGQIVMTASFSADELDRHNAAALIRLSTGETVLAGIYGRSPMKNWDAIDEKLAMYLGIKTKETKKDEFDEAVSFEMPDIKEETDKESKDAQKTLDIPVVINVNEQEDIKPETNEKPDDKNIWSGYALSVRHLFEGGQRHEGFEELPGITFAKAVIASDETKYYLIGADLGQSEIKQVYIAIPGEYAQEAPPSLAGSTWYRDGSGAGFWIKCAGEL